MSIKKTKPEGKTLAQRLGKYFRDKDLPFDLSLEQKKEMGYLFCKRIFSDGRKHYLKRKEVTEPEGTFTVIVYPPYLVRVLDRFIHDYFKETPVEKSKMTA